MKELSVLENLIGELNVLEERRVSRRRPGGQCLRDLSKRLWWLGTLYIFGLFLCDKSCICDIGNNRDTGRKPGRVRRA